MDKLETKKIAIIGQGHIGSALKRGLINAGIDPNNILTSNKSSTNVSVSAVAEVIFIAVKPAMVKTVLNDIKKVIKNKILISLTASVSTDLIKKYVVNDSQKIIRIMPNIPISINEGIIGLYANENVNFAEKKSVMTLLSNLGFIVDLDNENAIDTITLVAACGPAIVSYFIGLISSYAIGQGMKNEEAKKISRKTFEGTLSYLKKSKLDPQKLIESVATKGGVTETILTTLEQKNIDTKFNEAIDEGKTKIKTLAESLL